MTQLSELNISRETLVVKLIDTWVASKGVPIPWNKAVEILAIITYLSSDEKAELLALGN